MDRSRLIREIIRDETYVVQAGDLARAANMSRRDGAVPAVTGAESVSLVASDDIHVDGGFASRTI